MSNTNNIDFIGYIRKDLIKYPNSQAVFKSPQEGYVKVRIIEVEND